MDGKASCVTQEAQPYRRLFPGNTEMAQRMCDYAWASSPLGPPEQWDQSLRATVRTLLVSRYPMVLIWGEQLTQLYNDAYSLLIGARHPAALGEDIRVTLAESWNTLGPLIEEVMRSGEANWNPDLLLELHRAGYSEEAYFTVSHAPAENDAGEIVGMLAVCSEVTDQVLGQRRLQLLRTLSSRSTAARGVQQTCRDLLETLGQFSLDVPFAALFLGEEVACVGLPDNVVWAPLPSEDAPVEIPPPASVSGGPWGHPVQQALVLPVWGVAGAKLATLVAGISPNRALDESYRSFFELLAGQIAGALRNAQAYDEAQRRAETLAELDRTKSEFFSNVSHEFRTPLTLILGPLDQLLAQELPSAQRETLQTMTRNAARLLKLVNNLLDFSRLEAGQLHARKEPTDLAAFTAELASLYRSAIESAGLDFRVECQPLSSPVEVDRDMWEKIVLNLLSNAHKYTVEGSIELRLSLRGAGEVMLEVSDTGIGIDPEDRVRVFERFQRASRRGQRHEGAGIGLALVQELVRLHGGHIELHSSEAGSRFTVTLPLQRNVGAAAPAQPSESSRLYSTEVEARQAAGPAGEGRASLLVVDDNADMRAYVQSLLTADYHVHPAASGEEALTLAAERDFDLVLSDVMMPGIDGFELVEQLRQNPRTRLWPVILLSARAGEGSRVEGVSSGADDYLVKPFSARELLARVGTHLRLAQERQEAGRREEALRAQAASVQRQLAGEREASRLKDEFLATVSHELRTPLTSILGWARLLQNDCDVAVLRRGLNVIIRNSMSQEVIINDILDASSIASGGLQVQRSALDLREVTLTSLEGLEPTFTAEGVELRREVTAEAVPVLGDAERIGQILTNVLSNALKFTPEGGRVCVSLSNEGVCTVSDDGCGIPQEFLPHVFERFRQADSTTTRRHGGLGLGLSIVWHLMRQHGGDVEVASAGPGQGTTVCLTFPLLVASTEAQGGPGTSAFMPLLGGVRLLVVDDDLDTLELLDTILRRHGALVRVASDAEQALERLLEEMPDCLISDLAMPDCDGFELLARVRQRRPGLPALALTAFSDPDKRDRALRSGFTRVESKPIEPQKLAETVVQLLR